MDDLSNGYVNKWIKRISVDDARDTQIVLVGSELEEGLVSILKPEGREGRREGGRTRGMEGERSREGKRTGGNKQTYIYICRYLHTCFTKCTSMPGSRQSPMAAPNAGTSLATKLLLPTPAFPSR